MSDWIRNQAPSGINEPLGPLQLAWIGDAVWELHQRLRHGARPGRSDQLHRAVVGDVLKANKLPSVLDLSKIDFLDSSGLGALVQLAKQCTDAKRSFVLVGNSRVTQTIKLVRLEEFLHLVEDLPTALNQLAA